jgi:hypothetical protein
VRDFTCVCGGRLFFENTECLSCGRPVGFDPAVRALVPVGETDDQLVVSRAVPRGRTYRYCANRTTPARCNWLVPASERQALCLSCRLTETIPDISRPEAAGRWERVEKAKRRLLFSLLELGLPVVGRREGTARGMGFAFLEDRAANPLVAEEQVLTGHRLGLITVNLAEADDVERERIRAALGERYRTLLGHLRHEAGHHYWRVLVERTALLEGFRAVFGDERIDYDSALAAHYARGDDGWQDRFVSQYASAHPFEDWAETFAYYLHFADTLQTAGEHGVLDAAVASSFDQRLAQWLGLVVTLNALNRSMGLRDPLPAVLGEAVVAKLRFVDSAITQSRGAAAPAAAP